jgi:hypothetical protein
LRRLVRARLRRSSATRPTFRSSRASPASNLPRWRSHRPRERAQRATSRGGEAANLTSEHSERSHEAALAADLNVNDPLLDVAMELEQAALKDPYFVERKLYPNVDFYSGIIYKALKIPTEMFTVMFAIGRTAGWVAHWLEQHLDKETKIGRPRQIYTGSVNRDYVALDRR